MTAITMTDRQLASVLAGLRMRQHDLNEGLSNDFDAIATNEGAFDALSPAEIDALCEALNAPAEAGVAAATVTPELVDTLLCSCIECGYDWFDWSAIVTEDDPEMPGIPRYVSAKCAEWDGEEGEAISEPLLVDAARVAAGIEKIMAGGVLGESTVAALRRGMADPDSLDLDLNDADAIMQAVVFGELRYG